MAADAVTVASDGQCSIREAIANANADGVIYGDCAGGSGADVLELATLGTYEFVDAFPIFGDDNALPIVTDDLTIHGNGSVFRRPAAGSPSFRFLEVRQVTLEVRNLTFENGALSDATGLNGGGAILVQDGRLETQYSDFIGNVVSDTGRGGAVLARGSELVFADTRFLGNETAVTSAAQGGGAVAIADGPLTAVRCAFVGNNADGAPGNSASGGIGGALLIEATVTTSAPFDVVATISHSTISSNTANSSGAVALVGESGPGAVVLLALDYVTVVRNDGEVLVDGIGLRGNDHATYAVYSNSVLHSNGSLLPDGTSVGVDCQVNLFNAFSSSFGNLLDVDGECPADFFDDIVTDRLADDLGVLVVVDHHIPVVGGMLVDHAIGSSCTPGVTLDQLGKVRANGEGSGGFVCDIGSIESYSPPSALIFSDGFELGSTSQWSQTTSTPPGPPEG